MCRPVTSDVSALSGCVANGHQALHYVSSSPSKIPYGGFSPVRLQTGRSAATFGRNAGLYAAACAPVSPQRVPTCAAQCRARRGHGRRGDSLDVPVQRPLARQRVILSRQVIAYYGLIRASRPLLPAYVLRRRVFAFGRGREVPQFTLRVLLSVPSPVPRRTGRLRLGCCFAVRGSLRPLRMGSASA